MEQYSMRFVPKEAPVSYQEVSRKTNYVSPYIHRHNSEEINFIPSRSVCQVRCNGCLWKITAPAILVHRSGTYHEVVSVSDEGEPFESRVVYYDLSAITGIADAHLHTDALLSSDCTILLLSPEEANAFASYFELLRQLPQQEMLYPLLGILSRISKLLSSGHPALRGSTRDTYTLEAVSYIQAHLADDLTIDSLAKAFHVSPSKLKADFRSFTGLSVKKFVTQQRLRHARHLLETTRLDIGTVGSECGFPTESHFIDTFRTAFGTTPGKYRTRTEK